MNTTPSSILKKPKIERNDDDYIETTSSDKQNGKQDEQEELDSKEEQKAALIALIEHRSREVQHLKQRIAYYSTQLAEAEKRLEDSQSKLTRLSGGSNAAPSKPLVDNGFKDLKAEGKSPSPLPVNEGSSVETQSKLAQLNRGSNAVPAKPSVANGIKNVKVERISPSPIRIDEGSSRSQPQSRAELVIPPVNLKAPQPVKSTGSSVRASSGSSSQPSSCVPSNSGTKVKVEKPPSNRSSNDVEVVEIQDRGTKRKIEQKEHKELIPLVCSSSSPCTVHCHTSNHISSQHKRKLRSIAICPANPQLFVTSALDGMVNIWQLQSRVSGASLLSTTDCLSPKQRRWPEDIAWHPMGNSLFSIYTADSGDSQISVLNLNKTQGRDRVTFLEDKPHVKGIINSIAFMPWENSCFATGGSDHAVVLWNDKDDENIWKPKALHRNMHSSAVMGVAGMQHKQMVLSAGADKRIVGFDVLVARAEFKHQLDSKCMSVLPNPCDFNLFMVQTGTHGKQLRLFDVRLRQTEIHSFGFKQESSDSQSALINQAWSPDGLYLTSGSVDPVIHIFDIRYTSHKPSQSIRAHQKRVFKAVWHYSHPLLISISSDLHIGLHKIL